MADSQNTMKLHILLEEQENINLIGLLFPDKTEPAGLLWLSDNEETAAVTSAGIVTGVKAGTAKITVKTADSSMEDSVMVLVMAKEETGLRLSILLKKGETCRLVAMFGSEQGKATWSSADEAVATVDQKGRVTAVAVGTALVTVTNEDGSQTDQVYVTVRDEEPKPTGKIYGIKIDKNNPNPETRVTYLYDAEGKRPAHMNYEEGVFDYGDWADVWFVKENKPCMLKYDGTVDYYLNPNDYSKKEDGTPSDVSNVAYDGNAMVEFPLIWMKQYEEGDFEYIFVSNSQVDAGYHAFPYVCFDGRLSDKLYLRMFEGSAHSNKLRSLSGQTVFTNLSTEAFSIKAEENGSCWTINSWSEWDMISSLLCIISKSTDTQTSFGAGHCQSQGMLTTGTLNNSGQFQGFQTGKQAVKVFHMENWWGNTRNKIHGLITNADSQILIKMTAPYKSDKTGYYNTGMTYPEGFLTNLFVGEFGKLPKSAKGSATTYYCDYVNIGKNGEADVGENFANSTHSGAFCISLIRGISATNATTSASLTARKM